jgi:O-antigen ligase
MKFLRIGIYALVVFGIMAHGGVEEWARAVFETGTAMLFIAWSVYVLLSDTEQLVFSPLLPPLAAFALLALGQWLFHATASSYETRTEFLLLLADLIVLFLVVQIFRTLEDWRGFIWFAMGFGFLISVFGILQHLAFNGKLYWFREMRYGGIPFGPYANRNHFAGFAELIIPIALVPLVLGKVRRERWLVVGLFAVLPIGALFLSASRGGILSFCVELAVIGLWIILRGAAGKQALAAGAVLLAALLMVSWIGVKEILQRFSAMQSLEMTAGKRASMRRDTWRIFLAHPILGTGLGTLQTVFPPYETLYDGKIVNHTHNDYLEALAETGFVGGICCLWFLGVLFFDSARHLSAQNQSFAVAIHLSALTACIGFLVHGLVDFNLHIPANALLFFLMAQLAIVEFQPALPGTPLPSRRRRRKRKPSLT